MFEVCSYAMELAVLVLKDALPAHLEAHLAIAFVLHVLLLVFEKCSYVSQNVSTRTRKELEWLKLA